MTRLTRRRLTEGAYGTEGGHELAEADAEPRKKAKDGKAESKALGKGRKRRVGQSGGVAGGAVKGAVEDDVEGGVVASEGEGWASFVGDVHLVFDNAMSYNAEAPVGQGAEGTGGGRMGEEQGRGGASR